MKKIKLDLSSNIVIVVILVVVCSILAWQFKMNADLKQSFGKNHEELDNQRSAARHLDELEKQMDDLREKENNLIKKVPNNEKQPFTLIKTLMDLGNETGLKEISFKIRKTSAAADSQYASGGDLNAAYLEMNVKGQFPRLLAFLNKLNGLQRLVLLEKINIKRDKASLPEQKITLELVTFSFTQ